MRSLKFVLLLIGVFVFVSCKSKSEQASKPKFEKTKKVEKVEKNKTVKAEKEKSKPEKKEVKVEKKKIDKAKLKKVFIEVYCAEKKGDSTLVLKAYQKNGYEKPSDFAKEWKKASKDSKWVQEVFTEAQSKCK